MERFDTPEALARHDAESHQLITEKREEVLRLKEDAIEAKERAADCKKKWEVARNELEALIGERQKWRGHKLPGKQPELPFERPADVHTDGGHALGPGQVPKDEVKPSGAGFKADAPHSDLWRQFPISRWTMYGCVESDIQKLAEGKIKGSKSKSNPIRTVGDLSDFCQPWESDPSRNYTFADIQGIGEAGATRISDAQIRFFAEWNTKGLDKAYAREQGVNLDAKPADGSGSEATGGDGDSRSGSKGSKGQGKGQPRSTGKPKSAGKAKPKSTPKRKPEPAEPTAEEPATVPFKPAAEGTAAEPEPAAASTAG